MASAASIAVTPTAGAPPQTLPALRAELSFSSGPLDARGYPTLIIADPTRNAYFRLEWPASAIVEFWQPGPLAEMQARLRDTLALAVTARDIASVTTFLRQNELLRLEGGGWRTTTPVQNNSPAKALSRLTQQALFFRVPVFNPDRLLHHVIGLLRPLCTPAVLVVYGALVALGLLLTARQWDHFIGSAGGMFSVQALPAYAVLLFVLKLVHEAGHALVAKHYGCHVPSMGFAMMLGVPVLYTDTTDTWRLADRWQRLMVVLAGVAAEMLVAGLALLLWALLPDGLIRQLCLAVVTVSVITSLAINLNPCMRFDGYFALSDILGIANLQDRAFRLTRAHLRAVLFGLPLGQDPDISPRRQNGLIIYGYATWAYRLALYFGIAAMLYAASFKLLGLALFLFEMIVFVALPLRREVAEWWKLRAEIQRTRRSGLTAAIVGLAIVIAILPLNRVVEAPALLAARDETTLHARVSGRLVASNVSDGQMVEAGATLFEIESPPLVAETLKLRAERAGLEARLARTAALDSERDAALVVESQLRSVIERQRALERMKNDLTVRAPISGQIVDVDPLLRPGVWLNPEKPLARIASGQGSVVHAYVAEADAARIAPQASGAFIAESGTVTPVALTVATVAATGDALRLDPILADTYGGPVASAPDKRSASARSGLAFVTLHSADGSVFLVQRGTVRIAAQAESPVWRLVRHMLAVLTRESGF